MKKKLVTHNNHRKIMDMNNFNTRKLLTADSLVVPLTPEYSPRYVKSKTHQSFQDLTKNLKKNEISIRQQRTNRIKSRTKKQEEYGLKRQMMKTKQWGRLKQIVKKTSQSKKRTSMTKFSKKISNRISKNKKSVCKDKCLVNKIKLAVLSKRLDNKRRK